MRIVKYQDQPAKASVLLTQIISISKVDSSLDIIISFQMKTSFLPPFSKILLTSLVLFLIGAGGLLIIIFSTEPTLGPRWLMFFFLTLATGGLALPFTYLVQRRVATRLVDEGVLIREALLCAIFIDLIAWLQLGRVLNWLIILFLAGGFFIIEFLLRMSENATFHADEGGDE